MLKYHVAVCDDEKSDLDGIVQSVQQYDVQGCFDIETYMDGNELLSELQMQKKSFDLLLLDIEMPSNGFQLAQSLIQMEKHPLVVFVTKRHEYAVQGYGIAFRYLVKPLDQTLFAAAMDAVLQELNSKHFTIEYDGVTMSLETSDIYFLESHGHKVLIHCKEQDLTLRMSMQAVAEHGDTEELHKIAQAATDIFERSTNVSAVGNPVVDALLNYYLRIAEKNNIKVKLDVTIPEVLTISSLSLSIILGNTFDNAIEACCSLPAEQRTIHLQLRKQYRSLFYRLENPYSDTSRGIRIGEHHGYGLKNINRIVQENHGDFYTKKKDGVFTVQVRLNCEN